MIKGYVTFVCFNAYAKGVDCINFCARCGCIIGEESYIEIGVKDLTEHLVYAYHRGCIALQNLQPLEPLLSPK